MTSPRQFGAIHSLAKKAGLADEEYRALLQHHTGKVSSKALSGAEAGRVIEVLKGFAGQASGPRPRADRAAGKYQGVLQALWLSGFHLGLIRDRSDTAMHTWLRNRIGVAHSRFLVDHADAQRAIEALKQWLGRAGVRWTAYGDDPYCRKLAVLEAVAKTLEREGGFTAFLRPDAEPWPGEFVAYGASRGLPDRLEDYADADVIALTVMLGERLAATREMAKRQGGQHVQH